MMTRLAQAIVRRYPTAWRERYEDEVIELVDDAPVRMRDLADLAHGLIVERWRELLSSAESPRRTEFVLVMFGPLVVLSVVLSGAATGWLLRLALGPWSPAWADVGEWALMVLLLASFPFRWRSVLPPHENRRGRMLLVLLAGLFVLVSMSEWGELVRFDGSYRRFSESLATVMALGLFWLIGVGTTRGLWPDKSILDPIMGVEVAEEQLRLSRAWVEGCHVSASQGIPAPLAEAEAQVVHWEAELLKAKEALHAMGYCARFQR